MTDSEEVLPQRWQPYRVVGRMAKVVVSGTRGCFAPPPSELALSSSSASLCSSASSGSKAEVVETRESGLWGELPWEVVDSILALCTPTKLVMLASTCTYFRGHATIERIAQTQLRAIPRARSLKPAKHETLLALLHFVHRQSTAAAQATAVSCGSHHTTALLEARTPDSQAHTQTRHALYTFGRNFHGQLGTGRFDDCASPTPVSLGFRPCQDAPATEEETMAAVVSSGAHHSMAMSRRGELFSWGLCRSGALGQGAWGPLELSRPRQCHLPHVRIVAVSCGASHTLAIGESGCLWACGSNGAGQLGVGNLVDSRVLTRVQHLPCTRIVSVAAGAAHSIALASDGSLYTWGDGSRGQLGHDALQAMALPLSATQTTTIVLLLPQKITCLDPCVLSPEHRVTAMAAGSQHTLVLTVGGGILAFGANESGCLGVGDETDRWSPTSVELSRPGEESVCTRAVQVSCGAGHSLALVSKQGVLQVRAAGRNTWGQLGVGDCLPRCRFSPTLPVPRVSAVQAGDDHSVAVTEDGHLLVWGRGDSGQLGLGDTLGRRWPTPVPGVSVVHPDKTLRRNKRTTPVTRPAAGSPAAHARAGRHPTRTATPMQ
ncbi:hypothetical protein FOA52_011273 [Chlamydomonas sp. UWO 241]|nr:hypothetical protein FOA52_011273 [Chlamydomonas sp. UWO 241]